MLSFARLWHNVVPGEQGMEPALFAAAAWDGVEEVSSMLVEQRTYTFHPGQAASFLDAYTDGVCEVQSRVLGKMIGYFTTEIGPLNQTVHLWGYDSLDDRQRRRKALVELPEWQAFLTKVLPLIMTMETKILVPTWFSPIR